MLHELRKATCGLKKLHFSLTRRSIDLALKKIFSDNYNFTKLRLFVKTSTTRKLSFFRKCNSISEYEITGN